MDYLSLSYLPPLPPSLHLSLPSSLHFSLFRLLSLSLLLAVPPYCAAAAAVSCYYPRFPLVRSKRTNHGSAISAGTISRRCELVLDIASIFFCVRVCISQISKFRFIRYPQILIYRIRELSVYCMNEVCTYVCIEFVLPSTSRYPRVITLILIESFRRIHYIDYRKRTHPPFPPLPQPPSPPSTYSRAHPNPSNPHPPTPYSRRHRTPQTPTSAVKSLEPPPSPPPLTPIPTPTPANPPLTATRPKCTSISCWLPLGRPRP